MTATIEIAWSGTYVMCVGKEEYNKYKGYGKQELEL